MQDKRTAKRKFPFFDLLEACVLITALAVMFFYDPFKINYKITDFLRLKFPVFIREPKLLFYSYIYIGSFIAKLVAVIIIVALVAAKKLGIKQNLALCAPKERGWINYILPFAIFAAALRIYYSGNPLVPNLPLRLVFPEAVVIGNTIIIFSVLFIAPVAEELIFRGYLFDVFSRSFGALISVFLTSVIFALAHMPQLDFRLFDAGAIFVLGLILGTVRHKTGSTVIAIFFHGLYNFIYVIVGIVVYFALGY